MKSPKFSGRISERQKLGDLERKGLEALKHTGGPKNKALIAVSGGRDSVALLHFLVSHGWSKLVVVHLNHSLRGRNSDADAKFVKQLAAKCGLRCEVKKADIARIAQRRKLSLETAGRETRREYFSQMARKHRCKILFTAHHADDQAETVLHRICRGASLSGASGMSAEAATLKNATILRPLLQVTRTEINEYIAEHGLKFREDKSNLSPAHTRNRVRHELLPLMNEIFRRDVSPLLGRFAEQSARDDAALHKIMRSFAENCRVISADGTLKRNRALLELDAALSSRLVFHWLRKTCGVSAESCEVEMALDLLRTGATAKKNLPGGAHLLGDGRRLWVEPAPSKHRKPRPRLSRQHR